jgi:hypothetical protein
VDASNVDPWVLQDMQQGAVAWFKEGDPLDSLSVNLTRLGRDRVREPRRRSRSELAPPEAGGGEVSQISSVAAKENRTQIDQAVDELLDWCEFPGGWPLAVFHLAGVLEEGHVVGRGLDTQHDAALVVHLDRAFAEAVLDAGPFDTGGEL